VKKDDGEREWRKVKYLILPQLIKSLMIANH